MPIDPDDGSIGGKAAGDTGILRNAIDELANSSTILGRITKKLRSNQDDLSRSTKKLTDQTSDLDDEFDDLKTTCQILPRIWKT